MFNRIDTSVIENFADMYGLSRKQGETDAELSARIRAMLEFRPRSTAEQRLLFLLAKLGISSAKKTLPVGIV